MPWVMAGHYSQPHHSSVDKRERPSRETAQVQRVNAAKFYFVIEAWLVGTWLYARDGLLLAKRRGISQDIAYRKKNASSEVYSKYVIKWIRRCIRTRCNFLEPRRNITFYAMGTLCFIFRCKFVLSTSLSEGIVRRWKFSQRANTHPKKVAGVNRGRKFKPDGI